MHLIIEMKYMYVCILILCTIELKSDLSSLNYFSIYICGKGKGGIGVNSQQTTSKHNTCLCKFGFPNFPHLSPERMLANIGSIPFIYLFLCNQCFSITEDDMGKKKNEN